MDHEAQTAAFFARNHEALLRSVARLVPASRETIEDACAFAWLQYHRHQPAGPTADGWLFRVAVREARHLRRREVKRGAVAHALGAAEGLEDPRLNPEDAIAARDAFVRLPPRHRQVLALSAAGLNYHEMMAATGDSFRTVDRQLVRARAALRAAFAA
jgi:RNA polymerase sigma factor (sigma-70 family)